MTVPASFLDLAMAVTDSKSRPLDFAILQSFERPAFTPESLRAQALASARRWPQTKSRFDRSRWVPLPEEDFGFPQVERVGSEEEKRARVRRFVGESFDLKSEAPVRQLLLQEPFERATLVTHFHHAVCDLVGAAMWLDPEPGNAGSPASLWLKRSERRVNKGRFAHRGPSAPLWSQGKISAERDWKSLEIDAEPLREIARRSGRFTYNDLLCTAALESAKTWNREHGLGDRRVSVWLPVNIRESAFQGFGNGTSRIRIYSRRKDCSFAEKCAFTREQVAWSKENGEWAIPDPGSLAKIPPGILKILLKAYFRRPWVDMGTILFSHAERLAGPDAALPTGLRSTDVIANLHERYPLAIAGTSDRRKTRLTFTYDPELLSVGQVEAFVGIYRSWLDEAAR